MSELNFYLPASNVPLLQKLPGFENFDPPLEVLHCVKPGAGVVDAPRAFSIKLQGVTEKECKMKASKIDAELCMRHDGGRLSAAMTTHVDDLKLTGEPERTNLIQRELHKLFGELKVEWYVFTKIVV